MKSFTAFSTVLLFFATASASPWIPSLERSLYARCTVKKNDMPQYYEAILECKSRARIYDVTLIKAKETLEGDAFYWDRYDSSKGGTCLLTGQRLEKSFSVKVTCNPN